jgi:hypothetical protein
VAEEGADDLELVLALQGLGRVDLFAGEQFSQRISWRFGSSISVAFALSALL